MRAIGVIHECTVANQVWIQAAVIGVIDLLGHQSIKGWAHMSNRLLRIDLDRSWLLRERGSNDKKRCGQQGTFLHDLHRYVCPSALFNIEPALENVCRMRHLNRFTRNSARLV